MAEQKFSPADLADAAALSEALKRSRLQVVELYSDWAGPTQALPNLWRKIALEHDGELPFDFSSACFERCKEAEVLATHRSTSQPQFLLFRGGKQVAYIEGVDPPGIHAAINKQLALESGAAAMHQSSDSEAE